MLPSINPLSTSTRTAPRLAHASHAGIAVVLALGALAVALLAYPAPTAGSHAQRPELGTASNAAGSPESPNATCPPGGQCFADVPSGNSFYEFVNRIYMQDLVTGYACGGPGEPCDAENRPYYRPGAIVTRQQMAKFIDNARRLSQIRIEVTGGAAPIYARNTTGSAIGAYSTSGQALTAISTSQSAIYAQSGTSSAIFATATGVDGVGVQGLGDSGVVGRSSSSSGGAGVSGWNDSSVNGQGVMGISNCATCTGVYGQSSQGWAGYFFGNVNVTGTCCAAGAGSFKIDHPLDPANKYLNQALVQSPDMTTVINGNATLDANGEATVTLPSWFAAANGDFRYTLTAIGSPGPNLHIAQELTQLSQDRFKIAGGVAKGKVSWQVTGVRQDPYANANRIPVEEDKPVEARGKYLHPAEWGQPESGGVGYDRQQRARQSMRESVNR